MGQPAASNTLFDGVYADRSVMITGHTGFKGSWLSLWLETLGAQVFGLALPPNTQPSLFETASVQEALEHREVDIRDFEAVLAAMQEAQPEVVFHLAAQPLVRLSYREPRETFDANVGGTVNVLEAIRLTPSVKAAVIITTDKCYENREWIWGYRENDPMGGHDPYSASKGAAELAISAWCRSFFSEEGAPGVASARAGNVIGGGDWAEDRIVPDAIRAVLAGTRLEVRSPHSVRPWQHVLEPLSGYLALGARLLQNPRDFTGAWNFGPSKRTVATVGELVGGLIDSLGAGAWKDVSDQSAGAPHEAGLLWLNCDKVNALLKWYDLYSTEIAVQRTAAWYRQVNLEGGSARQACVRDIEHYVHAAQDRNLVWAGSASS